MAMDEWSREQDIAFENALAIYDEDTVDRWEKIAADVPGKTVDEIKRHYEILVDDVNNIEAGNVPLPDYEESEGKAVKKKTKIKRLKGIPWTADEHRLFLEGLEECGKGDWRSISRNHVLTRTPTQVASHAQKYFLRQNSTQEKKERRRSSIHDVTHAASSSAGQSVEGAPPAQPAGIKTSANPIEGPVVSAVGTPANDPAPGHISLEPVSATDVQETPMNSDAMTYTVQHKHAMKC